MRVIDFGSGKSYLTFAVWYFLHEIKKIPVEITGLDLKEDVIRNCQKLSEKLGCSGLNFKIGNIADYSEEKNPDMIITLHACDTATDYALEYAVRKMLLPFFQYHAARKKLICSFQRKSFLRKILIQFLQIMELSRKDSVPLLLIWFVQNFLKKTVTVFSSWNL